MASVTVATRPAEPQKREASVRSTGHLIPGPKSFNCQLELNGDRESAPAKYPDYLPRWGAETLDPPLQPFEHVDRGVGADGNFSDLLRYKNGQLTSLEPMTPTIGSEISSDVQLSALSDVSKNQLALLVAKRKVVVFRDQDFKDLPIPQALDFGSYFGRHHIHPTNGTASGSPKIQVAHRGAGDDSFDAYYARRASSVAWHSDVTFEEQPPGLTILYALETPSVGGDTLFSDQVQAYRRLSPPFQQRLHGLKALHSGANLAQFSREKGGLLRREPVESIHPLIRTHPATGEKALFVNKQFTRHIIGMKQEESDCLLNFLYTHIAMSADFQCRVKWAPGTVVLWDNRVTAHTAIFDFASRERRHLARITPQAERPYETPFQDG